MGIHDTNLTFYYQKYFKLLALILECSQSNVLLCGLPLSCSPKIWTDVHTLRKQLVPKQYGMETNTELVEKLLKDGGHCDTALNVA